MTRLAGPDEADRLVYLPDGLAHADGATGKLWADAGQSSAADVLLEDGTSVSVSGGAAIVTIDSDSKWPRLQFPADGSRTIYGSVNGGTVVPLRADLDSQSGSAAAGLAIVFGG
jgi:hypothetical protein